MKETREIAIEKVCTLVEGIGLGGIDGISVAKDGKMDEVYRVQLSVCPEKANFEILNFRKATTYFIKACYGFG